MSDGGRTPRRQLCKNKARGKLFGVCAGVADYFGYEAWVVRLVTVTLILFAGPFSGPVFIAYFVLAWVLDCKSPMDDSEPVKVSANNGDKPYRPDPLTVWRAGTSPKQTMSQVESAFAVLEQRLRALEGFVTSSRFQWEKQFKEINH